MTDAVDRGDVEAEDGSAHVEAGGLHAKADGSADATSARDAAGADASTDVGPADGRPLDGERADGGHGDDAAGDGASDGTISCTADCGPPPDAGGCGVSHSNGEGQTFRDCVALGTDDQTQATEACVAFTSNSTQCDQSSTYCSSISYSVCSVSASTCRCWQYSGPNPGTVQAPALGCSAQCGSATDPAWN